MKVVALLALVALGEAARIEGIDKKELQDGAHWRKAWPQGIDDSNDDDKIMNWPRKPKKPDPPIQYHDKMRQWVPGTWPVNFKWNKDWDHAAWKNEVDDGTDDNEVVDLMHRSRGI